MYNLGQTLYKLDSRGKVREWKIEVVDNTTFASIVTTAGLQDGKQVVNTVDIFEGKNIGKANETSYYTQAVSEALATAELKLRGEYRTTLENMEHQTLRSGIKAPMLAQKYHPQAAQSGSKTLEKMKLVGEKIHVQPKLDGNRCLIKVMPTTDLRGCVVTFYTRKGDVMPVQLPHIADEVSKAYGSVFFADGFSPDTPEVVLDGELFSTEMSFNELNGHLKRKDSQDPAQLEKIKYHLYDIMLDQSYDKRYKRLELLLESFAVDYQQTVQHIHLIPSYEIEAKDETINEFLEKFLAEGHEGLMIRRLDMPYENKRSWQLCKVKIFEDAEFIIHDLLPDVMGRLGKVECHMDVETYDRDGKLVEYVYPGITGITHEEGMKMLADKDKYIGKMATVEFFGRSEIFVPRFPKFKAVRD
jgi:DNA ligase-1